MWKLWNLSELWTHLDDRARVREAWKFTRHGLGAGVNVSTRRRDVSTLRWVATPVSSFNNIAIMSEFCPPWAPFFGWVTDAWRYTNTSFGGVASAVRRFRHILDTTTDIQMILTTIGAAYGTSKSGIGIAGLGQFRYVQRSLHKLTRRPDLIMKVRTLL